MNNFRGTCSRIEEAYESCLHYAAQGQAGEAGSAAAAQARETLLRMAEAIGKLETEAVAAARDAGIEPVLADAYIAVLAADARAARAGLELVLAQTAQRRWELSSQLLDTLNASVHLRALLTSMFLLAEVLEARVAVAE